MFPQKDLLDDTAAPQLLRYWTLRFSAIFCALVLTAITTLRA